MPGVTNRLDAFTDAAFAFALSLLVVGQRRIPTGIGELTAGMADVPAFAIGFAIVAMFWYEHVRLRRLRGEGGAMSVLITFSLEFRTRRMVSARQRRAHELMAASGLTFGIAKRRL